MGRPSLSALPLALPPAKAFEKSLSVVAGRRLSYSEHAAEHSSPMTTHVLARGLPWGPKLTVQFHGPAPISRWLT
jgi:hypothetical protein